MNIAIIGSRDFTDFEVLNNEVKNHIDVSDINNIVSGGAKGADSLGEHFAEVHSINTIIHKPDWEKYGRGAGFIRNRLIIDDADIVFAFWDGKSKGTKNSIDVAKKLKKTINIYYYDNQ